MGRPHHHTERAARQGAIFAAAPFAGALLALRVLGERIGLFVVMPGAAMAGGVGLLASHHREHPHTHDALQHDHLHTHDAHHRHEH